MPTDYTASAPSLVTALEYSHNGYLVLPLHNPKPDGKCSCGKVDCKSIGKHPRLPNGVKGASSDADQVRRWFGQCTHANIGIATGAHSGIAVLDIDVKSGGLESLKQLEEEHEMLPRNHLVKTGSGGYHFYFQYPGPDLGNRTGVLPGVDFKTDGGFIVAPPSIHACGNPYEWVEKSAPPVPIPEWLLDLLKTKPAKSAPVIDYSGEGIIPDGMRNSTLYSLACSLRNKGIEEAAVLASISAVNATQCRPPLDQAELESIASSACRHDPGPVVPDRLFLLTDVGNAQRLVAHHGQDFRYCHKWNKFVVWDNARFVVDETGRVDRLAKQTIRQLYESASRIEDHKERTKLIEHALKTEHESRINGMIKLARTEEGISVSPDVFDQKDWQLNCSNGTINLKTGELKAHDRTDLHTKLVPLIYDPQATCPLWEAFLNRIMAGQQDLIDFLQKAVGYSLTGSTAEQCLFILHGSGANGKSVFQNTVLSLLGEYGQQTPTETLMVKKQSGINNDVARLRGSRFISASEGEQNQRLAESLIKQLTGGDTITARFLHGEFFEFQPKFKIFLATNHKPVIKGTDNGIWRRMRLIPFSVVIPEAEQDRDLSQKLRAELPGILRWAVEGCLKWQREGLTPPEQVAQASAEYRSEMDSLQAFIDDQLALDADNKVSSERLYGKFRDWCEANGERTMTQRSLGMQLKEKGFESRRSGSDGSTFWHGIALKTDSLQAEIDETLGIS